MGWSLRFLSVCAIVGCSSASDGPNATATGVSDDSTSTDAADSSSSAADSTGPVDPADTTGEPGCDAALCFDPPIDLPTDVLVTTILPADVDGDGAIDLVVAGFDATTTQHLLLVNDGTGTFTTSAPLPVLDQSSLHIADVDHDGLADLVTARGDTIEILRGADALTSAWFSHTFPDRYLVDVAVHDDEAGVRILAHDVNAPGLIGFSLDDPDAATVLTYPPPPETGISPSSLEVGDFDGDGALDVAALNNTSGVGFGNALTLWIFAWRDVDGHAEFPQQPLNGSTPHVVGDFDGDGQDEWVAVGSGGDLWSAPTAREPEDPFTLEAAERIAGGDMNADGIADLVGAGGDTVTIALDWPTDAPNTRVAVEIPPDPVALAVADVDGDGSLDIITAHADANRLAITRASP